MKLLNSKQITVKSTSNLKLKLVPSLLILLTYCMYLYTYTLCRVRASVSVCGARLVISTLSWQSHVQQLVSGLSIVGIKSGIKMVRRAQLNDQKLSRIKLVCAERLLGGILRLPIFHLTYRLSLEYAMLI